MTTGQMYRKNNKARIEIIVEASYKLIEKYQEPAVELLLQNESHIDDEKSLISFLSFLLL